MEFQSHGRLIGLVPPALSARLATSTSTPTLLLAALFIGKARLSTDPNGSAHAAVGNPQPSARGSRSDLPSGPRQHQSQPRPGGGCRVRGRVRADGLGLPGPHVSWQLRPVPSCLVASGLEVAVSRDSRARPVWQPHLARWGPHPALGVESGVTRPTCHMRTPAARGPCDSLAPWPFHPCSLHTVAPQLALAWGLSLANPVGPGVDKTVYHTNPPSRARGV